MNAIGVDVRLQRFTTLRGSAHYASESMDTCSHCQDNSSLGNLQHFCSAWDGHCQAEESGQAELDSLWSQAAELRTHDQRRVLGPPPVDLV